MFTSNFIIGAIIVLMSIYTIYFLLSVAFGVRDFLHMRSQAKLEANREAMAAYKAAKAIRTANLFS